MNWTWHNNFIQERLLNVEESPILFSVPSVILQRMMFIRVISVIMCLFLSETLNFGLLTPAEKDRQKLQLLKKKKKRQTIFIQSVTCKSHLSLVLNASEYVY